MYHYRCISQIFVRSHVRCAVNAQTGFESSRKLVPAKEPKRVLVVGGGPAGMEAARLASLRGHQVVLAESAERLGGRFRMAAQTATPNDELLAWLESEMGRQEVDVRLKTSLDVDAIADAAAYDEVIVATGARAKRPDFPGAERREVVLVDGLWEEGRLPGLSQEERVVILGGDKSGLGLASYARAQGADVEVLEETEVFAAAVGLVGRWRYVHDARESGIRLEGGARIERLGDNGLEWIDRDGRSRRSLADRVWIMNGMQPDASLAADLKARGVHAYAIGDCASVGFAEGAMESAAEVVLGL